MANLTRLKDLRIELSIFDYEKDNGEIKYFFTIDFEIDEGLISNDESIEEI